MRKQPSPRFLPATALVALALLLAACAGGGPVRRVSEPAANVQQLTVQADGSWLVDVRIDNFSSVPMRFDRVDLKLALAGQEAASLRATPGLSIGPESADVVTVHTPPPAGARIAIADTLARGRSIHYHLQGTLVAAPEKGGTKEYEVERDNALSPVPGVTGVLR